MHKDNGLFGVLYKLFLKVSEFELLRRLSLYSKNTNTSLTLDISGLLENKISALVTESRQLQDSGTGFESQKNKSTNDNFMRSAKPHKKQSVEVDEIKDSLALHYKQVSSNNETDQYIGERLKKSAWSHIHTAIMQARSGEERTARLHVDIAGQALKEAAHYMQKEEYRLLCEDIKKSIVELNEVNSRCY